MARVTSLLLAALAAAPYAVLSLQQEPKKVAPLDAQRATEVMITLKAHCQSCHGTDSPAAGLDLTTPKGIAKGGVSGKLFVPGKPEGSLLVQRLMGLGGKPRMPMGFVPLSDAEMEKVKAWIQSGGLTDVPNRPHWAFVKPARPAVPVVGDKAWVRNPIDAFVLAGLQKEKLKPAPEASREVLLRRVYLDLIGLPPTVEELDAFLADKRPDAYERVVDKLLANPHYGERQARGWMDLARYADSDGYEKDLNRTAWKWRDWVIDAFNANMPYDRFTIEQLAGDQLPNPTVEDLVATGFNRNTMQNLEGGVDQAEAHFNVVLDRVATTSTVWLGTTLACARCHDHKYDPLSQKDFYQMAAFFSNSVVIPSGSAAVGEEKWLESQIDVPSAAQVAEKEKLTSGLAVARRKVSTWTPELRAAYETWLSRSATVEWKPVAMSTAGAESGSTIEKRAGGVLRVSLPGPVRDTYVLRASQGLSGVLTGLRLESLPADDLPGKGAGRAAGNGNFVVTNVLFNLNGKKMPFSSAVSDYSQQGFPAMNAIKGEAGAGWAVAGDTMKPHQLVLQFAAPVTVGAGDTVEIVISQQYPNHSLGQFRVSATTSSDPASSLVPGEIGVLLDRTNKTYSPEETSKLEGYFLGSTPLLAAARSEVEKLSSQLNAVNSQIPTALIMRDKPHQGPLTAFFRERGEYLSPKEKVTASTPAVLPPMPAKPVLNRLDLAKWLVSPANPLTARVQVNRMWEQYFGRGIVETSENFGTQGSKPSHPELLDWLATEFMARKWDMKAMHRLIVTSATYRQSSAASKVLVARDPANVLLARGPRFRMEAEMVRDTILTSAGVLNPKIGGPSVYPYQPDGVWDTPYSGQRWMYSKDNDKYRRGLYTFWKRTMPFPSFITMDATSREECTVRRTRTNTPLQALALLNDQGMFDAAKALGARMASVGGSKGIVYGFRAVTGRRPSGAELSRLKSLLGTLTSRYAKDTEGAKKIAETPEKAAWAMTANVLLNLDETITKG